MLEAKAGVFVGTLSGMVRDRLWEKACSKAKGGGCMLIHRTNNEQGFAIRLHGHCKRTATDFEGLTLIRIPAD